jgi:hypothetical protein
VFRPHRPKAFGSLEFHFTPNMQLANMAEIELSVLAAMLDRYISSLHVV